MPVSHDQVSKGFEDSRRLTGANLYLPGCGAALETLGGITPNDEVLHTWQTYVLNMCQLIGWPSPEFVVRKHKTGASLVFSARLDQLYCATEINEWAWLKAAECEQEFYSPAAPSLMDDEAAFITLQKMSKAEARPDLIAIIQATADKNLPCFYDDEWFSIGEGEGSQTWPIEQLPQIDDINWKPFHPIPTAVITGSNGKTTTTRLVAAMCREHGWHTGHNCTDGLFMDGVRYEGGDYSGPMGARAILRNRKVQAGVLETARGGILRRGLAVQAANVAAVTNISPDHFGEYGIHDVSALADVKLTVAHALDQQGVLVLNADDAELMKKAYQFDCRHAYFSIQENNPHIDALKNKHGITCTLVNQQLYLNEINLGSILEMPLTVHGNAKYNIENLAAAACIAYAMGVSTDSIRKIMHCFGKDNSDNPGRLQRWQIGGITILIDYAHNPEGLHGFLSIARSMQANGRMALLLGQAGNRENDDIRELAKVAAEFIPDFTVLKDIDGFIRGREAGEVAAILQQALHQYGIKKNAISIELDEVDAVRSILVWAKAGDLLALPIHSTKGREEIVHLMQRLVDDQWHAGNVLPARNKLNG